MSDLLIDLSLEQLCIECQGEMKTYIVRKTESIHCKAILCRAASGDDEALGQLLFTISYPIILRRCPQHIYRYHEDLQQEVGLRLLRQFRRSTPQERFVVTTFAAYRRYLTLTIESSVNAIKRRLAKENWITDSADENEVSNVIDKTATLKSHARGSGIDIEELLDRLPPLQREALYRRYALGESVSEILAALQQIDDSIKTKKQVYRLIELALRKVRK